MTEFYSIFGNRTALWTITFAKDLPTREAHKKRANLIRRVLRDLFGPMITVREYTERGRVHFHALTDCLGDVTTGFDWDHYDAVTAWSKAGCKGPKPEGSLNRTPLLATLHEILREKGPAYGIGRMELVPVRDGNAIGFYLGGYLSKSLAHKPADAKGTRSVNYPQGCPRIFKGGFSWANERGWLWRAKLR